MRERARVRTGCRLVVEKHVIGSRGHGPIDKAEMLQTFNHALLKTVPWVFVLHHTLRLWGTREMVHGIQAEGELRASNAHAGQHRGWHRRERS